MQGGNWTLYHFIRVLFLCQQSSWLSNKAVAPCSFAVSSDGYGSKSGLVIFLVLWISLLTYQCVLLWSPTLHFDTDVLLLFLQFFFADTVLFPFSLACAVSCYPNLTLEFLSSHLTLSLMWRYFVLSSWSSYQVKLIVGLSSLGSFRLYIGCSIRLATNVLGAHSLGSRYPCLLIWMNFWVACKFSWSAHNSTNYSSFWHSNSFPFSFVFALLVHHTPQDVLSTLLNSCDWVLLFYSFIFSLLYFVLPGMTGLNLVDGGLVKLCRNLCAGMELRRAVVSFP